MLTEENLIKIDNILRSSGTTALSNQEIDFLNAVGTGIATDCDHYSLAQKVALERLKHQLCDRGVLSRLKQVAIAAGCALLDKKPQKPKPVIPLFGGGSSSAFEQDEQGDSEGAENAATEAKAAAVLSKRWAVGPNPPDDMSEPDDDNNSFYHSEQSRVHSVGAQSAAADADAAKTAAGNHAQASASSALDSGQSAGIAQGASNTASEAASAAEGHKSQAEEAANSAEGHKTQAESAAILSHDWAVGPTPPSGLEAPSMENNAHYWAMIAKSVAIGAIKFGGIFTVKAAKEYPDHPDSDTLWLVSTETKDGYTFTTGSMAGQLTKIGDWLIFLKDAADFVVQATSPLHVNADAVVTVNGKAGPNPVLGAGDVGAINKLNGVGYKTLDVLSREGDEGNKTQLYTATNVSLLNVFSSVTPRLLIRGYKGEEIVGLSELLIAMKDRYTPRIKWGSEEHELHHEGNPQVSYGTSPTPPYGTKSDVYHQYDETAEAVLGFKPVLATWVRP